jgi:2-methylisocitrate lyase-like PEP mutase family enzyme
MGSIVADETAERLPPRHLLLDDDLMLTQMDKAQAFRSLHQREGAFVIPNPWDAGSARLLQHLGFEALATTSAGFAFTLGRADYQVNRDEMLAHIRVLAEASSLPVSADLENGFGDAPEVAAETISLAAAAGAVGGSIEDATGSEDSPIYEFEHAVDRVRAAAEAAHGLEIPFTLTARCENYLVGRAEIGDTIRRLQAYQQAGADVLYAPGLTSKEDIAAVVSSLDRPVNVLAGLKGMELSVADLAALGVKRISVGGALARAALGALLRAAKEMREQGTFTYTREAATYQEICAIFNEFDA